MTFEYSSQALLFAASIFVLRALNQSLDTIRIMVMMRGRKLIAWVLGFSQSLIYLVTLTSVLNDLNNLFSIIAYAAGFASGNVLGIWLEARLAIGYFTLRIVSAKKGKAVARKLRDDGYAVTEIKARGRDGAVSLLNASVRRRDVESIRQTVEEIDEKAFITGEEMRPIWRGFWRRSK